MTLRAHFAEFLGTALIATTVIGSGIMAQQLSDDILLQLLVNSLATVFILGLAIWLLAPVSGAYFNPAVLIVALSRRMISLRDFLSLTLVQCAGAVVGAVVANGIFERALIEPSTNVREGGWLIVSEILATAGLVAAIFVSINQGRSENVFWLVSMWIGAAYFFTSSTCFANPAITLGRSFTDSFAGISLSSVPGFVLAQITGAYLGNLIANLLVKPIKN